MDDKTTAVLDTYHEMIRLVDLWKDLYVPCLEAFYPKLNPGAVIVADNMLGPDPNVKICGQAVRAKRGITSALLPVGSGIEASRFEPAPQPPAPRRPKLLEVSNPPNAAPQAGRHST
jgi:hypothetical protein